MDWVGQSTGRPIGISFGSFPRGLQSKRRKQIFCSQNCVFPLIIKPQADIWGCVGLKVFKSKCRYKKGTKFKNKSYASPWCGNMGEHTNLGTENLIPIMWMNFLLFAKDALPLSSWKDFAFLFSFYRRKILTVVKERLSCPGFGVHETRGQWHMGARGGHGLPNFYLVKGPLLEVNGYISRYLLNYSIAPEILPCVTTLRLVAYLKRENKLRLLFITLISHKEQIHSPYLPSQR